MLGTKFLDLLRIALVALATCLLASTSLAEVGDPTLRTSHPQYAGEGAFQSIDDCVQFATAGAGDAAAPQDKAIAMYLWLLAHQWHLYSPQECFVPGTTPDARRDNDYENVVYDANRARFSYGYGLCGTVHAWNEPYWKALGMNARRRAFPGHTNSEIEYGGSWHAFDTDMAGLLFRKDGIVAGYEDIQRDPALVTSYRPPLPGYPFAWPGDRRTMEAGWREVAKKDNWYKMYHGGYAAHPGVVHLRSGETFTRHYDRDRFGGPSQRRFWHHQPGGPERDWAFFDRGIPFHDGEKHNSKSRVSYANGEFVYEPDLTAESHAEGAAEATANVEATIDGLRSSDRKRARVVFAHFSPYVICGDPEDDANPMSGKATGGLVIAGRTSGKVQVDVSADEGQSWQSLGDKTGAFEVDLTEQVKGRYGWRVRFSWEGAGGLDAVKFTTVTQVCQAIYPRLTAGGTEVVYRAQSRSVVPVLPNLGLDQAALAAVEEQSLRSANIAYAPRSKENRLAWRTTNNKPGSVAFKIASPTDLVEVTAAVRFAVRVPPPQGCDFHLEISTDAGKTWREFARADLPADNEYSSGWMYGRTSIDEPGVKAALVRAHLYAGGYPTGIIDAQLYGLRRTSQPQPVTVTYAWLENGAERQHIESFPAGKAQHAFTVPTGETIADAWVRIAAE